MEILCTQVQRKVNVCGDSVSPAYRSSARNQLVVSDAVAMTLTCGDGVLDITEEIGNNGTALNGINVGLGLAASNSLNSDESLSSEIASIHIPFSSGRAGFTLCMTIPCPGRLCSGHLSSWLECRRSELSNGFCFRYDQRAGACVAGSARCVARWV